MVGFGEVDDGAFPSLAVGATSLLFDELWKDAGKINREMAFKAVEKIWPVDSPFRKPFQKIWEGLKKPVAASGGVLRGEDIFLPKRS